MPKISNHTKNGAVTNIKAKLSKLAKANSSVEDKPVWEGPQSSSTQGGITQSMLNGYLFDMERFRIKTVLGYREEPYFSHHKEYGNFWHILEEHHAKGCSFEECEKHLSAYVKELCRKYPTDQYTIVKWYYVAVHQFPCYVSHWSKHKDTKVRKPYLEEQTFQVEYMLPSERIVYLRGKFDSVGVYPKKYVELQENKSKGEVNAEQIQRTLNFDLQTMFYMIALKTYMATDRDGATLVNLPTRVRYNVVVRPLSGGKHSIQQRKGRGAAKVGAETDAEFYKRLQEEIESDPSFFFHRWLCDISEHDITRFKVLCLNPVLENLCDDFEWWAYCCTDPSTSLFNTTERSKLFPYHTRRHYVVPFGMYNPIAEGRGTPYDEYILTDGKSTKGLIKEPNLFPELTPAA